MIALFLSLILVTLIRIAYILKTVEGNHAQDCSRRHGYYERRLKLEEQAFQEEVRHNRTRRR